MVNDSDHIFIYFDQPLWPTALTRPDFCWTMITQPFRTFWTTWPRSVRIRRNARSPPKRKSQRGSAFTCKWPRSVTFLWIVGLLKVDVTQWSNYYYWTALGFIFIHSMNQSDINTKLMIWCMKRSENHDRLGNIIIIIAMCRFVFLSGHKCFVVVSISKLWSDDE